MFEYETRRLHAGEEATTARVTKSGWYFVMDLKRRMLGGHSRVLD